MKLGGEGGRSQAGNHCEGGLGQTSPQKPNFYSTYFRKTDNRPTKHQQTGEVSHYELKYLFQKLNKKRKKQPNSTNKKQPT